VTIRPLSSGDLLQLWERAETRAPGAARALLVLEVVYPDAGWDSLSMMSVGRRDRHLLDLRERLMGSEIALCGECPECQERVDLALNTRDLAAAASDVPAGGGVDRSYKLEHGGAVIEFRLPDSADLDAAGLCGDVEAGRRQLLDRCVLSVVDVQGSNLRGSELSIEAQSALEREMDRIDPLAVPRIDLVCPECGHGWSARLDISDLVTHELSVQGRLLLEDIAALAGHYHWSEESILRMSARRRQSYLELAGR